MSIRTTITLDEDVYERLRAESKVRGIPFRQTVNDLIRSGFVAQSTRPPAGKFEIKTYPLGTFPGVSYDSTEGLLELGEGEFHR